MVSCAAQSACALGSFPEIVVSIERLGRLDELAMDDVQLLYTIWCSRQLGYIVCGWHSKALSLPDVDIEQCCHMMASQ